MLLLLFPRLVTEPRPTSTPTDERQAGRMRWSASTNVFDAASRQIAYISPLGYRSSTIYDAASRTLASQDALGFFWTSVYDGDGRRIGSVDPLGNRNSTIFNAVGQTIGQVDALGNRTSTVFDPIPQAHSAHNRRTLIHNQLRFRCGWPTKQPSSRRTVALRPASSTNTRNDVRKPRSSLRLYLLPV